MEQNIVHTLQQRELDNDYQNFVRKNYFNPGMIKKMEIQTTSSLGYVNFDDAVKFLSWNSNGTLLACGQPNRGVKLLKPFRGSTFSKLGEDEGFIADTVFMPKFENMLAVGTRKYTVNLVAFGFSAINFESKVKIWDVETAAVTRKYEFDGLLQQVVACPALPNNIWFNLDSDVRRIAEADVRTSSYSSIKLNIPSNQDLIFKNCFDVNPVDGMTVAVGGRNRISYFDRRMLTSDATPFKFIDLRPLRDMDLIVVKMKYHPNGRKILKTVSLGFQNYISNTSDTDAGNMRAFEFHDLTMLGTILRNPNFLGDGGRYVMFDTFFRDFIVIFDSEDLRYLGKIKLETQESNSGTESAAHPCYCLIALASRGVIHFITPTSSEQT